jgi:hypothetical protein
MALLLSQTAFIDRSDDSEKLKVNEIDQECDRMILSRWTSGIRQVRGVSRLPAGDLKCSGWKVLRLYGSG